MFSETDGGLAVGSTVRRTKRVSSKQVHWLALGVILAEVQLQEGCQHLWND
jgi:hypothetical protein